MRIVSFIVNFLIALIRNFKAINQERLKTNENPRSSEWPKVRDQWLKDNPTCAACGGKEKLEVHHKYPFAWPNGAALELDPNNFITLCEKPGHDCHLMVGHLGDWKSRNSQVCEDSANLLKKIQCRPYPGV